MNLIFVSLVMLARASIFVSLVMLAAASAMRQPSRSVITTRGCSSVRMAEEAAPKEIVIVGGGWAGYTAGEALSASPDCRVTLLEAASSAGALPSHR